MATVRCVDCGYLAVRDFKSRQLVEVEAAMREAGWQPKIPHSGYKPYEERPICFVRSSKICNELDPPQPGQFLTAIKTDRQCDKITPWHQGFSPREHLKMNLLEEQRERDRKWRLEDVKAAEEAREQSSVKADSRHLVSLVVNSLFALAAIVAVIVAAYIGK